MQEEEPKSRRNIFSSSFLSSRKRKVISAGAEGISRKVVKKDVRSIFKKTSKDDVLAFTFEEADAEMKERCPLFWNVLRAASMSTCKAEDEDIFWKTSVVTAAAVCFKNRSKKMTVVQLLISLILNHSSYTVSILLLFLLSLLDLLPKFYSYTIAVNFGQTETDATFCISYVFQQKT